MSNIFGTEEMHCCVKPRPVVQKNDRLIDLICGAMLIVLFSSADDRG